MVEPQTQGARQPGAVEPLPTDEERRMLRDSLREFLEKFWPAARAVELGAGPGELRKIWRQLAGQGLASLGSEPAAGGLRETLIVMEELGRAACPAPMAAAALLNLALWPRRASHPELSPLLEAMHAGEASPAFSFAGRDGDRASGSVGVSAGRASGRISFVDAGESATHFVAVVGRGSTLAVIAREAGGCSVEATRAMGGGGLARVDFDRAPAQLVPLTEGLLGDLDLVARLALAARSLGAAERAFEMAVAYAKERKQFGQPIGRFQAVQHKLANCLIALEGVRLTLANAAAHYDRAIESWRVFAQAACAFAGESLRRVSLETHHAFGAVGYAEEHEAPRHFKRVHLDALRHGGARRAREQLAEYFLGEAPHPLPEYDLGPSGNAFRAEVRAWLAQHWSGARKAAYDALPFKQREYDPSFARDLGKTGWLGMSWPREFGGQARTPFEQLAFMEEMERAEAPRAGAPVQAAMLMVYGTPAQQQRYLPKILSGEAIYGMGYSEPDAGSDLAAMRTRAERRGDEWVINGQKIWTTTYWGQYMLLAARTDPDARPPHAGLSLFIVPMDSPGVTVKPSTTMYDGAFANVFYDDVRLPADALVGAVNAGWQVLTGALATERGFIGGGIVTKVAHAFDLLCEFIRGTELDGAPLRRDPLVRDRIGELAAQIEVGRQMMVHCAAMVQGGETPLHEAAMSKVFSGELMERFGETALDILGMEAALSEGSPGAILRGRVEQNLRHSLMWVISIGTNEIQRSLIAQRGLGLPR